MNENELRRYTGFETFLLAMSILSVLFGYCLLVVNGENFLFIAGLSATIFGAVSKILAASKGISGGFQWGWWLGVIGFIVVCAMPSKKDNVEIKSNIYEDLEKLMKLKESGAITDTEFEVEKQKLLK